MSTSLSEIKDIAAIASPVINPIASALVKSLIVKFSSKIKSKQKDISNQDIEMSFTEYLIRSLFACENLNILIFQNQQVKLDSIYYPLTLMSSKDGSKEKIDDFKLDFIKKYERVLISDTAGMGKSTLTKFITKRIIEKALAIPILIELRNLRGSHTVLDEIFTQFNPINNTLNKDSILTYLESGKFIILMDGFDEILLEDQGDIISDIRSFINKVPRNCFIMTSRPEGALASFGDFQSFNIVQLEENQSYELIEKYDSIFPTKVGDQLIQDIKTNFKQTKELLGNPFLVSLIYTTYTFNRGIPSSKATFYDEIYSALFKRHDLSKSGWVREKKSGLDILQFRTVLRELAFETSRFGKIAYTDTEALGEIEKALKKCPGLKFNPADFLDDLLSAVPLFRRDGLTIRWAHKSLQDYFCADFISFNEKKETILELIYNKGLDSFLNVLDLYYDIDYKCFRKVIVKKLLGDFVNHYETSYLSPLNIPKKDIDERKCATFGVRGEFLDENGRSSFGEITSKYNEKVKGMEEGFHLLNIRRSESYTIIITVDFKYQLLQLLSSKKATFLDSKEFAAMNKNDLSLKAVARNFINDDPNSIVNAPEYFSSVTRTLYVNRGLYDPVSKLNYKKAIAELRNIQNQEIDSDTNLDIFAGL